MLRVEHAVANELAAGLMVRGAPHVRRIMAAAVHVPETVVPFAFVQNAVDRPVANLVKALHFQRVDCAYFEGKRRLAEWTPGRDARRARVQRIAVVQVFLEIQVRFPVMQNTDKPPRYACRRFDLGIFRLRRHDPARDLVDGAETVRRDGHRAPQAGVTGAGICRRELGHGVTF